MAIETKTKQWGNSIGVIIPSQTVERLSLKPEESIVIEVSRKENVLKELFGKAKTGKSADKIMKEVRKDLESKWLK
jgi:antitoxin component of MazEF toxin-antitoxin module